MDSRLADVLAQTDRAALGGRLRSARQARGLTQGEVADDVMSVAYLSRIESGLPAAHRARPRGAGRAARRDRGVAARGGGQSRGRRDAPRARLRRAVAGVGPAPGRRGAPAQGARRCSRPRRWRACATRARLLHARALEATKREDDAVLELESLIEDPSVDGLTRIKAGIALSRIFRETGDLGRAIECGERVMSHVEDAGLGASDEAVQLAVTVAAAHFERGDTAHAVRLCRKAIARAESLGSPKARASAYWNASVMQARRGDVAAAVPLAERALALMGEGQDSRNLARLRGEVGRLQLELDPPDLSRRPRQPRAGGRRHGVEQRQPGRHGVDAAGPGPGGLPRRRPHREPRPGRAGPDDRRRARAPRRGRGADPGGQDPGCRGRDRSRCGVVPAGGARACRPSAPTRALRSCGSTSPTSSTESVCTRTRWTPTAGRRSRPDCGRAWRPPRSPAAELRSDQAPSGSESAAPDVARLRLRGRCVGGAAKPARLTMATRATTRRGALFFMVCLQGLLCCVGLVSSVPSEAVERNSPKTCAECVVLWQTWARAVGKCLSMQM